jgi:dienelactone hydrolase
METAKVDWRVLLYGNTMHAFATPQANDPKFGTLYHPASAKRAWQASLSFLEEVLTE